MTAPPGAIGDYLCRELTEWCRNGHRWDKGGEALKIVDHLNALATDKATTVRVWPR